MSWLKSLTWLSLLALLLVVPYGADSQVCPVGSTCNGIENYFYSKSAAPPPYSTGLKIPVAPSGANNSLLTISASILNPCSATLAGTVPTPPNDVTKFLNGLCLWSTTPGGGDVFLNAPQSFTKSQGVAPSGLTPGATITPDFSASNNFSVTIGAAANAIANPINIVAGKSYHIVVTQDATGGRTIASWGSDFKWSGGTVPTLSTAANAIDLISCYVADVTHFLCGAVLNFQ